MADLEVTVDTSQLTGLIKTTNQTKQAVKLMSAEFARTGNQGAYLRSINQIVAAQNRLPNAARMSRKEIMRLGQEYRQQALFADELAAAQMRMNAATNRSARGINRSGVIMQQSGYQIGDFIVQVQSGTNAFVAFGQQATQVAGTLTMLGGKWLKIGSVLGIAIPLITAVGAAFMRTRQEAEEATDSIEDFAQKTRDMFAEIQAFGTGMSVEEIAQRRRLVDLELERIKLIEERNYLESIGAITSGAEDLIKQNEERQAQIRQELDLRERANQLTERNERITEMAREAARRFAERLREEQEEAARIAQERKDFIETETTQMQAQIDILGVALQYGRDSIQVEEARAEQARQAYLLEVMRQGIYGEQLQSLMDIYDEYTKINLALSKPVQGPSLPSSEDPDTPPSGRSAVQEGVGGVARSLLTDVEQLQLEFEERRAAIEEFNAIEIELFGSKNEAIRRLEEEHQAAMREIQNTQEQQRLKNTSGFFGNMATIAKAGGEKTFKIYKGFAIAQALVDAYASFNAVLKDPTFVGRPWQRAAAAGAALAQGLAQVQNIRGVTSSGGGGGAAGGGAVAAPAAAAAPEPQQVVIEGIDRDSLISGEQLSKLFDRLYEENDERGIVFSVAR